MNHLYTNDTLLASGTFDRDAICTHFSHLHFAASRADVPDGKLVLAVYGEDPGSDERFATVQHFAIGDIEGMTDSIFNCSDFPFRWWWLLCWPSIPLLRRGP